MDVYQLHSKFGYFRAEKISEKKQEFNRMLKNILYLTRINFIKNFSFDTQYSLSKAMSTERIKCAVSKAKSYEEFLKNNNTQNNILFKNFFNRGINVAYNAPKGFAEGVAMYLEKEPNEIPLFSQVIIPSIYGFFISEKQLGFAFDFIEELYNKASHEISKPFIVSFLMSSFLFIDVFWTNFMDQVSQKSHKPSLAQLYDYLINSMISSISYLSPLHILLLLPICVSDPPKFCDLFFDNFLMHTFCNNVTNNYNYSLRITEKEMEALFSYIKTNCQNDSFTKIQVNFQQNAVSFYEMISIDRNNTLALFLSPYESLALCKLFEFYFQNFDENNKNDYLENSTVNKNENINDNNNSDNNDNDNNNNDENNDNIYSPYYFEIVLDGKSFINDRQLQQFQNRDTKSTIKGNFVQITPLFYQIENDIKENGGQIDILSFLTKPMKPDPNDNLYLRFMKNKYSKLINDKNSQELLNYYSLLLSEKKNKIKFLLDNQHLQQQLDDLYNRISKSSQQLNKHFYSHIENIFLPKLCKDSLIIKNSVSKFGFDENLIDNEDNSYFVESELEKMNEYFALNLVKFEVKYRDLMKKSKDLFNKIFLYFSSTSQSTNSTLNSPFKSTFTTSTLNTVLSPTNSGNSSICFSNFSSYFNEFNIYISQNEKILNNFRSKIYNFDAMDIDMRILMIEDILSNIQTIILNDKINSDWKLPVFFKLFDEITLGFFYETFISFNIFKKNNFEIYKYINKNIRLTWDEFNEFVKINVKLWQDGFNTLLTEKGEEKQEENGIETKDSKYEESLKEISNLTSKEIILSIIS